MLSRLHITLLLSFTVIVWAVTLFVRGVPITFDHLIPFGIAVSALTMMSIGFNRWCWRYSCFKGWLVQRPWLEGTWAVELQSDWIDPKTKKTIAPIAGFMTIRQTFSSLTVRLYTAESSSVSISATIVAAEDCQFELVATYQNDPRSDLRGVRSEIHYGTLFLALNDDPVQSMTGHYWTDRNTTGTLKITDRRGKLAASYAGAQDIFAS